MHIDVNTPKPEVMAAKRMCTPLAHVSGTPLLGMGQLPVCVQPVVERRTPTASRCGRPAERPVVRRFGRPVRMVWRLHTRDQLDADWGRKPAAAKESSSTGSLSLSTQTVQVFGRDGVVDQAEAPCRWQGSSHGVSPRRSTCRRQQRQLGGQGVAPQPLERLRREAEAKRKQDEDQHRGKRQLCTRTCSKPFD